jgi:Bacteriophage head-tail adaptor
MARIGTYRHRVLLQNPGPPIPDGAGGYSQSWADLVPAVIDVNVQAATARAVEYLAAGTLAASASHVVTGRHHPGVTTQTRVIFGARIFHVTGVANPEERDLEMVLMCQEQVP